MALTSSTGTSGVWRQAAIVVGTAAAVAGAAWGAGAWGGTPIQDAAGGALDSDATLLAPAREAFGIWSVIYAGFVAFAIFQALPSQRSNLRIRSVQWWVLASLVLNVAWIASAQAGLLWVSVAVLMAIVAVLMRTAALLTRRSPLTWPERLCVDAPVGLYLGWAIVATLANVAAAAVATAQGAAPGDGTWIAVLALLLVAIGGVILTRRLRAATVLATCTALAMAWGVWWIAMGRISGEPRSFIVGWVAGLAAAVLVALPFAMRDFSMVGKRDPLAPE